MILVDTSVWIDHLRAANSDLISLLTAESVLIHPFVIGELALGTMRESRKIIDNLQRLPHCAVADDFEVLHFIENAELSGNGIGYVDAHLLAAVRLTTGATLWTQDKRLSAVAQRLNLAKPLLH